MFKYLILFTLTVISVRDCIIEDSLEKDVVFERVYKVDDKFVYTYFYSMKNGYLKKDKLDRAMVEKEYKYCDY